MVKKPGKIKAEKAEKAPKEKIAEPQSLETSRIKVDPDKTERSDSLDEARTQELSDSLNLRLDKLGALVDEARAESQYKKVANDVMEKITRLENMITSNSLAQCATYTTTSGAPNTSNRCCECLSDQCCSFDIMLVGARILTPQSEIFDKEQGIVYNYYEFQLWVSYFDSKYRTGVLYPSELPAHFILVKKKISPGIGIKLIKK